jgi:hypothetical protein
MHKGFSFERDYMRGGQLDEGRVRTRAPASLARHDMGLATMIGRSDREARGQKIDYSIIIILCIRFCSLGRYKEATVPFLQIFSIYWI